MNHSKAHVGAGKGWWFVQEVRGRTQADLRSIERPHMQDPGWPFPPPRGHVSGGAGVGGTHS